MRNPVCIAILLPLLLLLTAGAAPAQDKDGGKPAAAPTKGWQSGITWRPIGPANMGGRITALAVSHPDKSRWWSATASGGLLRTVNDGITFEHQFDREATVSIGDVAVAPSNPDVVWVGTGEANPRNSVSFGNGVYKSVDGGATWKHMGLPRSFQIGQIRIHPENAEVVYVGALGRLWGPNEERGLYKTTDGGEKWQRILAVDENTGVIDVQMKPGDPDTLLVATYERQRDGFDTNDPAKRWGPGSGMHKSTDGGKTFRKITEGLPTCQMGRIGIDFCLTKPDIVYAVVETERIGTEPPDAPYMGITGTDAEAGAKLTRVIEKGPAAKAGLKTGDIVLRMGKHAVLSYADLIRYARYHSAGDKVEFHVSRERRSVSVELTFGKRSGQRGGRSFFSGSLGGQRPNVQDQQGKEGHEFGGLYRSDDGGETWTRVNTLNPRPMYFSEVRVDPNDPDRVYVLGIRLWLTEDGGKTINPAPARGVHVDHHALWIDPADSRHMILGNDGGTYVTRDQGQNWDHLNQTAIGQFYHVGLDATRDYKVFGGLQDNGSWGGPNRVPHGSGPANPDWFRVGGGDGFRCLVDREDPELVYFEMQNGGIARMNIKSGESRGMRPRAPRGTRYRFNWQTPFLLSQHNSRIYYVGGNRVFRSLDRGNGLRAISPEIAATDRGSATALAESPRDPDLLWVGTDDGALWLTKDGGHEWTDLFKPPEPPEAEEKKEVPGPDAAPAEPSRAERFVDRIMRNDTDGDGKLALAEVPERMKGMFGRLDANDDGFVMREEAMAAAAQFTGGGRGPRDQPEDGRPSNGGDAAAAKKGDGKSLAELMPDRRWVNCIEPSRFKTGRAYVVFDGHRSDDDRPHLLATEDAGATWRSLRGDLPATAGTTRVLREDLANENLLYLGTEFGAWASIDRGETWRSLNTNLPTVAVHGFALHPTSGEIVAATHGRSLWVLDVTVLRQLTRETLAAEAHLFEPNVAMLWKTAPRRGATRTFTGQNPPSGAQFFYLLGKKTEGVALRVTTTEGETIRELEASGEPGLHKVTWDLRRPPRGRQRYGPRVGPDTYLVVLQAGDAVLKHEFEVAMDPANPDQRWIAWEDEQLEQEATRRDAKARKRYPWLFREEEE